MFSLDTPHQLDVLGHDSYPLAWMAQRLVSSNRPTKYASITSCNAMIVPLWKQSSVLKSWATSLTSHWNGSFHINNSVDFWYRHILQRATVPGLYLHGFSAVLFDNPFLFVCLGRSGFLGAFPLPFNGRCFLSQSLSSGKVRLGGLSLYLVAIS